MTFATDLSTYSRNLARPNRYRVTITFPSFVNFTNETGEVEFMVKTAQVPQSTVGVIEVPYRGRIMKIPGDRTFEPWNITVRSKENYELRNAFERWSNAINSHENNDRVDEEVFARATVTQLSQNGEELQTYIFENVFPSEVGVIELSFDAQDTVAEFPVVLAYSHWTHAESTS